MSPTQTNPTTNDPNDPTARSLWLARRELALRGGFLNWPVALVEVDANGEGAAEVHSEEVYNLAAAYVNRRNSLAEKILLAQMDDLGIPADPDDRVLVAKDAFDQATRLYDAMTAEEG